MGESNTESETQQSVAVDQDILKKLKSLSLKEDEIMKLLPTNNNLPYPVFLQDNEALKKENEMYEKSQYFSMDYKQEKENDKASTEHSSMFLSFIKQIRPGRDLMSISAPPFLLRPCSFLEMHADYLCPKDDCVLGLANSSPENRILNVTKLIIGGCMYSPRNNMINLKPLNPTLGELFKCTFEHDKSTSNLVAEQVSHHPAITALYMYNEKEQYDFHSTTSLKFKFAGNSIKLYIDGLLKLKFYNVDGQKGKNETYLIETPMLTARNIFFGHSYVEHNEHANITCEETGYSSKLSFHKKKQHLMDGNITDGKGKKIYYFKGQTISSVDVFKCDDKEEPILNKPLGKINKYDLKRPVKKVAPLHEQQEFESRRVWHPVSKALINENDSEALDKKNQIEDFQRKISKKFNLDKKWVPKFFVKTDKKTKNGLQLYEFKNPVDIAPFVNGENQEQEEEQHDLD